MFDRFTEESRRALFFARVAVSEHGGTSIRDEHLLLGLLKAAPTAVSRFVEAQGAVQTIAECLIAGVAAPDLLPESADIPFDALAQRVLRQAVEAADHLGHRRVTLAHLLLSLLSEEASRAAICLRQAGVRRADVVHALAKGGED